MTTKVTKAKNAERLIVTLFVLLGIALIIGCDNNTPSNSNTTSNSNTAPVNTASQGTKPGKIGSITANPNPIQVCDGSGLGITTLSWDVPANKRAEVHVASPTGAFLALSSGPGNQATGKWVGNGTVFYLQDTSDELPLTAANTIATVLVSVTTQGCP